MHKGIMQNKQKKVLVTDRITNADLRKMHMNRSIFKHAQKHSKDISIQSTK